jgi:hypothetical protein
MMIFGFYHFGANSDHAFTGGGNFEYRNIGIQPGLRAKALT